ncbi:hypothetical protein NQ318_000583 [Aromia moschata]|uniref:Integrase p58-like C-terminal domain-containing protein n=1 Tax=Aromia moschata TaxID=1265417 RepID=A0AAV8XD44_9CUCU|nr:hypothetical protein NQ318_000583 [Aromia moschata]
MDSHHGPCTADSLRLPQGQRMDSTRNGYFATDISQRASRKSSKNDYDRIVGALEIRYGHKYLRQVYQSQIKSRQQRSNESLQEYEADIERLIHLAYPQAPKEFLEQIGIQTFIDGLVDTEMQQALGLGRHATISDALIAALEFKAAKEASRNYKPLVRQIKVAMQERTKTRRCGDVRSAPFCGQHDERVGDIKKQEQVHLRGRHGQTEGVLPVLDSSKDTCNELLMTTTVQVEDEWSSEEVMKSQKKDSDLKLIRNWVKNGVRPTWQEVSRYGTTIKGYWAQWSSLCLRDGLLHRKWESPDGVSAVYQLVLPKARIHQVLEELHSSPSGGHFGVTRTLARREAENAQRQNETASRHYINRDCVLAWRCSMVVCPKKDERKSPKLQSNWEGPYTIIKKINDLVYRIQLSPRSKPKVVHLERS